MKTQYPAIRACCPASSLETIWQHNLYPFWQQMQHGTFTSQDNIVLHYSYHRTPDSEYAIVISSGRTEPSIKYTELMFELVAAGYSVFILDHRGQGLSQRLLTDPEKGYVRNFSDYSQDFAHFIEQIVLPHNHRQHIGLAHSMGGCILAGYVQQHSNPLNAVILISPMFGIYSHILPPATAEKIILLLHKVNQLFSKEFWYFPGQGPYQLKPFQTNKLTTCQERYQLTQKLFADFSEARLGGATIHWLAAAIRAIHQIQQQATHWNIPVLLLQAEDDTVVNDAEQDKWWQQLPAALYKQRHSLQGAKHEIIMEHDSIREQMFSCINQFLQQLPRHA